MKRILISLAMIVLLCGAKSTIGQNFNHAALAQFEVGNTTLEQAKGMLGAVPQSTTVIQTGELVVTWSFIEAKASMWSGRVTSTNKSATLVFSPDGKFARLFNLQNIELDPDTRKRLMPGPAAAPASATASNDE